MDSTAAQNDSLETPNRPRPNGPDRPPYPSQRRLTQASAHTEATGFMACLFSKWEKLSQLSHRAFPSFSRNSRLVGKMMTRSHNFEVRRRFLPESGLHQRSHPLPSGPDPVDPVFDTPVTPPQIEQPDGVSFLRRQTGDCVGQLSAGSSFPVGDALQPAYLGQMGPVAVAGQQVRRP